MSNEKSLYILFEKNDGSISDEELINTMRNNIAMLLSHLDLTPCDLEDRITRVQGGEAFTDDEATALRTGAQMKLTFSWVDDTEAEFKQLLNPTEHVNL